MASIVSSFLDQSSHVRLVGLTPKIFFHPTNFLFKRYLVPGTDTISLTDIPYTPSFSSHPPNPMRSFLAYTFPLIHFHLYGTLELLLSFGSDQINLKGISPPPPPPFFFFPSWRVNSSSIQAPNPHRHPNWTISYHSLSQCGAGTWHPYGTLRGRMLTCMVWYEKHNRPSLLFLSDYGRNGDLVLRSLWISFRNRTGLEIVISSWGRTDDGAWRSSKGFSGTYTSLH